MNEHGEAILILRDQYKNNVKVGNVKVMAEKRDPALRGGPRGSQVRYQLHPLLFQNQTIARKPQKPFTRHQATWLIPSPPHSTPSAPPATFVSSSSNHHCLEFLDFIQECFVYQH